MAGWVGNRYVMEAYNDGGGLIFLLFMDSEWLERDLAAWGRAESFEGDAWCLLVREKIDWNDNSRKWKAIPQEVMVRVSWRINTWSSASTNPYPKKSAVRHGEAITNINECLFKFN